MSWRSTQRATSPMSRPARFAASSSGASSAPARSAQCSSCWLPRCDRGAGGHRPGHQQRPSHVRGGADRRPRQPPHPARQSRHRAGRVKHPHRPEPPAGRAGERRSTSGLVDVDTAGPGAASSAGMTTALDLPERGGPKNHHRLLTIRGRPRHRAHAARETPRRPAPPCARARATSGSPARTTAFGVRTRCRRQRRAHIQSHGGNPPRDGQAQPHASRRPRASATPTPAAWRPEARAGPWRTPVRSTGQPAAPAFAAARAAAAAAAGR